MPSRRIWLTAAALLTLAVVPYLPVWDNGFVDYDDEEYITDNPRVTEGLTAPGFAWAWTALHAPYWQPISWLSLQADAEISRRVLSGESHPSPAVVHGQNLFWHAASTLLLFGVLLRLTGAGGRSFLVAALFAVHPMHVESVAWAAERKDVLSVFFGLLTLWAYARYAAAPGRARYAAVVAAYALSLMAKPMLMTLPFALLLLDYWPLGRLAGLRPAAKLVWEKVPLFVLAGAIAVVTHVARVRADAIVPLENLPLSARLATAVSAYGWYLAHTAWPRGLAVLYPHPQTHWHLLPVLAGGAVLLGGMLVGLWQRRRRPWLIVGWLWFVGGLLPVIGLAQGGMQAWADRFTYWPHVGLFVAVVWALGELAGRLRVPAAVSRVAVALLLAALTVLTWEQVGYWHDTEALWERALAVTEENAVAHDHLAAFYLRDGRPDRAVAHATEAVCINPEVPHLHYALGTALLALGRDEEAAGALRGAVTRAPGSAGAWHNLGVARLRQGRPEQAACCLGRALELEPGSADTLASLGLAQLRSGEREEALQSLQSALEIDPDSADAWHGVGLARLTEGKPADAAEALARALSLNPGMVAAYSELGLALGRMGRWGEAVGHHRRAVTMQESVDDWLSAMDGHPRDPESVPVVVTYRCRLAFALDHLGDPRAADAAYREALRRDPAWPRKFRARARELAADPDEGRRDPLLAAEMAAQAARGEGQVTTAPLP